MKLINIFSKVRVVLKYGAIILAFMKAIEVLADELDKIKTLNDEPK